MAFKMNSSSFTFGDGTGYSPLAKKDKLASQSENAAARLAKKQAKLEARLANSTNEKQKARLANRISNVSSKAGEKTQQAENLRGGNKRRAGIEKSRTRNLGAGKLDTDKTFNESGKKVTVDRTLTDNDGNIIRGTSKTKTGTGTNKTVDKTITKSDGTQIVKKKDGVKVNEPVEAPTKELSFGEAFKQNKAAGKKEFTWKGKKYHTGTKDEADAKSKAEQEAAAKAEAEAAAAKAKAEAEANANASNNNPLVNTNTVTPELVQTSGGAINTTTYKPTTFGYGKF
tara:strand:+ start:103 stop:957 length:855 start_codon:yes stop_codon:yes gene_type:complete